MKQGLGWERLAGKTALDTFADMRYVYPAVHYPAAILRLCLFPRFPSRLEE
jgi:hypothetical protein